ncbi:MAG: ligase-associated DNA damage response exonuclease [Bacteroidia bacterium]|nr:ligase-associated DNA damage response exonuclease [Bacteroidia bacterium]
MALIEFAEQGIYCPRAGVYIDPWRRVPRALITHAHADHARWGMEHYLAHHDSVPVMRQRLGQDISVEGLAYGETVYLNGVAISLHPAGHIPGSAQIRLSYRGETWVVSGDYKTEADGLSTPFEPVRCDTFVTESTFGLPVYRWQPQAEVMAEINAWWHQNAAEGRASLLCAYALGKAQRLLQHLDSGIGPIYAHGAVSAVNEVLRMQGYPIRPTLPIHTGLTSRDFRQALIIAPPNAIGAAWTRRLEPLSLGIASGWMALRGARRRRAADRGFVLSDHADWDGLNAAVRATGASQVYVTHGYADIFARWLTEGGLAAGVVETQFEGEGDAEAEGNEEKGSAEAPSVS